MRYRSGSASHRSELRSAKVWFRFKGSGAPQIAFACRAERDVEREDASNAQGVHGERTRAPRGVNRYSRSKRAWKKRRYFGS
jgi:hypothetical protein